MDLEHLEQSLPGDRERNLIRETVFAEGDRRQVASCLEWLGRKTVEKEIALLQRQIEQAERSRDFQLVASLHSRKARLTLTVAG